MGIYTVRGVPKSKRKKISYRGPMGESHYCGDNFSLLQILWKARNERFHGKTDRVRERETQTENSRTSRKIILRTSSPTSIIQKDP